MNWSLGQMMMLLGGCVFCFGVTCETMRYCIRTFDQADGHEESPGVTAYFSDPKREAIAEAPEPEVTIPEDTIDEWLGRVDEQKLEESFTGW